MPRFVLLVALLLTIPSAADAGFRVSPEQPVAPPIPAPPEGEHAPIAVLNDGERFAVFWSDTAGLSVTFIAFDGKRESQVHGAVPFSIHAIRTSVCWTGSAYLVTWQDEDDDVSVLYAATLARDGSLTSSPHIIARNVIRIGDVAGDGRRAVVTYWSLDAPALQAILFDPAGAILRTVPLPIAHDPYQLPTPVVTAGDREFAVVWQTSEVVVSRTFADLHFLRIDELGTPLGEPMTLGRTEATGDVGVAFGGGVYGIAVMESHIVSEAQTQTRLVRFTVDPTGGAPTQEAPLDVHGYGPKVLWNGSRFIAYWMDFSTEGYFLMTVPFGQTVSAKPLSDHAIGTSPLLASNGRNVFAAWSAATWQSHGLITAVYGVLLDGDAISLERGVPFLVSVAWSRQFSPSLATSGGETLVVWIEDQGEYYNGRLLGVRMSAAGVPIDRTPIEIAPNVMRFVPPAVAYTGKTYLVVWNEPWMVVARTVGRDGTLGPRLPIGEGSSPAITSNMTTTLVVFASSRVFGIRFNAGGEPIDTVPLPIGDGYLPQVATNGTDFLVGWNVGGHSLKYRPPGLIDVFGARVRADGSVDAAPLPIATGSEDQILSGIASDGRDYLVVFAQNQNLKWELTAKRVLREGQLDGATSIVTTGFPANVAVVADDAGYWVAWTEREARETISLVHTDFAGNPAEPLTLASTDNIIPTASVALAHLPGRALQIAYARRVMEGTYLGTARVFFRFAGDVTGRFRPARH